jgi:hypothetical protein
LRISRGLYSFGQGDSKISWSCVTGQTTHDQLIFESPDLCEVLLFIVYYMSGVKALLNTSKERTNLNNFSTTLVKVVALAGGAVIGVLLGRWCDDLLAARAEKRSDYDKTRYAQGLGPRAPEPPLEGRQG